MRVYIKGRLGGKVADELKPYFRKEYLDRLATSQALLDYLYTQYYNFDVEEKALEAFDVFNYVRNVDFYVFKNDFVRLVGERMLLKA